MRSQISKNRDDILQAIGETAKSVSRAPGDITLVAVSKQQSDARIAAMLATRQRVFGENKVQEAQARWGERFGKARPDLTLHLIGPLQTNKAADAASLFDVIETLDREKLAKALAKAMDKSGQRPEFFVQVNTGEEPQKSGILPKDADHFLTTLRKVYGINPAGLMCIPPAQSLTGQAPGPHFALLKKIAQRNGIKNLSMGMSADYITAIRFGATHVRVGSALFGTRALQEKA